MKLLEQKCAGVAVKSRAGVDQPEVSSLDKPSPLVCEVTFDLSLSREDEGDDATEHFADRASVETAAARQLPDHFRKIADELEMAGVRDGAKTRSS